MKLNSENMTVNIDRQRYAGLWLRLKAIFVDCLILMPVWLYLLCYPYHSRFDAAVSAVSSLFFVGVIYPIFFHTLCGQTPGKMFIKIKVTKTDFSKIGFREAVLRSSVDTVFTVIYSAIQIKAIYSVSPAQFNHLGLLRRATLLSGAAPQTLSMLSYVWMIAGIAVIFMNQRKRALRDYIGETLLIKV